MSAGKVAFKSFEAIARRNGKIAEVVQPVNQVATVTQAAAGFSVGIFLISFASSRSAVYGGPSNLQTDHHHPVIKVETRPMKTANVCIILVGSMLAYSH